ncbi:hypothetical protein BJ878DRAFT_528619 [Calycina marina]|uniref:Myb-like domain-containing protein n=1 Tax=Calycina marina TaxID=1763456 RepID=A0A9P7YV98_9HELO|nr:hypothetical protein BJ878DRAFT_528619 [Calycina marina]
MVESAPVAVYQEWPFKGFLKRIKIGNETTYNLEFQLSHVPEHFHLPVLSEALGMCSAEAATPHNIVAHSTVHPAISQRKRKHVKWKPEENKTIRKMRKEGGCSWEEIHAALPHRTPGAIQVQYSKLKK